MSKHKDDKWLDELISRTINTEKPWFDAEKLKQKFPDEFQIFQSRATNPPARFVQWTNIFKGPIAKCAAAAVIVLAIGLLINRQGKNGKAEISEATNVAQSPANMLTLRSLRIAYRNGGIEAVETQCEKAMEGLGLQSEGVTVKELLADITASHSKGYSNGDKQS